MDVRELILKQATVYPKKPAIIFEGNQVSFSQLKDTSFKFANFLTKIGVKRQDKVAIFLPNNLEAVFSFLGSFSIGLTVVPFDFMLTQNEVIGLLKHSQAKILVTQDKKGIDLEKIKEDCPDLEDIILCGQEMQGFLSWDKIITESNGHPPIVEVEEDSLSSIFYTSGSTGHPKGVMLTYRHLDNPPKSINHFLGVSEKDIFLCGGVPFSHFGGLDYILLMIYFASSLVLMPRFQPFEFLKSIESYKVTIFCIVPAMYVAILSLKEADKFDLSSLRFAVVFGAPSSPVLLKKFNKICPNAKLSNGWGMTETAAPNTLLEPGSDKISSIGKFSPDMEAKIIDAEGNQLGANKQGELIVRGYSVMKGYYREDELTNQVLDNQGWLYTGDIAYYDEGGLFYIVGRKKDMIKVAGEIVFSAEVEEKIQRYSKVKEAAVIGVKDDLRGEVPKAFVVACEKVDESELREYLKKSLAHFKIPHYFEFVDELPKNRTGKIDKKKLV